MNFVYKVVNGKTCSDFHRRHKNGFFGALVLGLIALGSLTASLIVHAEVNNDVGSPQVRMAQAMAVADGITTYYGIHHKDYVEANKLMPSSKGGIAAITPLKVGVITYYDYYGTPSQRDKIANITSGTFGGAAVNNLLAASGVDGSVAVGAGVLSGIGLYYLNRNLANKFNGKNQIIAVNNGIGLQHRW